MAEDKFLQSLVAMINGMEGRIQMPIILNIGGLLISGELITTKQYFEGTLGRLSYNAKPIDESVIENLDDQAEIMKEGFGKVIENFITFDGVLNKELKGEYIHLRDARIYGGNAYLIKKEQGIFWRGKISSVDGFIFADTLEKFIQS